MEFKKEIKKDSYAVKITAEENAKAVGWAYLYIIFQDRHEEPYGLVENVYVEEEYRSRGVGTKLMEAIIQEARERNCYKLIGHSRTFKTKVHGFYEKLGLKKFGFEFRMDLKESKPKQRD
jgi:GNAT superfamily N-acetyltransferase